MFEEITTTTTPATSLTDVYQSEPSGELCLILRDRIRDYKKKHPRLSSQQIAKRFNMASSTFNRIENMDIKTPSLDQLIKVLRGTGNLGELLGFLEKFYPEISKTYSNYYSKFPNAQGSEAYNRFIENPKYFKILLMIVTGGLSKSEVSDYFGRDGQERVDDLIESEVIFFSNSENRYVVADEKVVMFDDTTLKVFILSLQNFLSDYTKGDPLSYLSYETWEIDSGLVMSEITAILERARSEICDILLQEKYKGNDKLFIGFAANSFFSSGK